MCECDEENTQSCLEYLREKRTISSDPTHIEIVQSMIADVLSLDLTRIKWRLAVLWSCQFYSWRRGWQYYWWNHETKKSSTTWIFDHQMKYIDHEVKHSSVSIRVATKVGHEIKTRREGRVTTSDPNQTRVWECCINITISTTLWTTDRNLFVTAVHKTVTVMNYDWCDWVWRPQCEDSEHNQEIV